MRIHSGIILFITLLWIVGRADARSLPRCSDRPRQLLAPAIDGGLWCLESVIVDGSGGEMAFTSLAVAPDGTLYATRPLTGQVLALTDSDGDGLPDTPEVVLDGLTLPNGLDYAEGALYISGGAHIYRYSPDDGRLTTLVDDLPSGAGFWTGGIAVGPDGRIYVGTGAPCDFCVPEDPARGAILSFSPDGGDRQLVATGLRFPADLAFRDGVLWTLDTAPDALNGSQLDELNRVEPGANFGWPYCAGDNQPTSLAGGFDCADATAPVWNFDTHNAPLGLAAYTSDTFPSVEGALLVALGGDATPVKISGYQLVALNFEHQALPATRYNIMPDDGMGTTLGLDFADLNYAGFGVWPHHLYDVAVSPEGWIYFSAGGGQIFALRP